MNPINGINSVSDPKDSVTFPDIMGLSAQAEPSSTLQGRLDGLIYYFKRYLYEPYQSSFS